MKRYINGFRRPFFPKGWKHFVLIFLVALLFLVFVRSFLFMQVEVCHSRPDLKLLSGDRVLVNRLSYGLRMPLTNQLGYYRLGESVLKVDDLIVFDYPDGSGNIGIDVVTAIPNDTLWLENHPGSFILVPDSTVALGQSILPYRNVIGRPFCISYSVDKTQPFYKKLRPHRLFIRIE